MLHHVLGPILSLLLKKSLVLYHFVFIITLYGLWNQVSWYPVLLQILTFIPIKYLPALTEHSSMLEAAC